MGTGECRLLCGTSQGLKDWVGPCSPPSHCLVSVPETEYGTERPIAWIPESISLVKSTYGSTLLYHGLRLADR